MPKNEKKITNKSGFEYLIEGFGWLQIVASPLLAGLVIGLVICLSNPTKGSLALGIIVVLIGLITGIFFATRVWKKHGTMHFVSRIMASPELDKKDEEQKYQKPEKDNNKNTG